MHKIARKLSAAMVALFTAFTALSYMPAQAAVVVPKVQYVSAPQLEYTAGDRVQFNLNAPNYGGRVQYRVVLWDNNKKQMRDLWTTGDRYYTNWQPYGNETFTLGWPITEPGSYRITIYAKRAGVANSKTALKGFNCDSYMESAAFVVKPAVTVDANYEAAVKAVAAYEAAPLTTLEQVTAAEALKVAANTAVTSVADAAKKAELTAKVTAQNAKVAAAKEVVSYVNVVKVTPVSSKTIKVEFDKEIAVPSRSNFEISEKNNEFVNIYVDSITVDKNVATLTLFDAMDEDTDYAISINGVKALANATVAQKAEYKGEFKYEIAEAAKIEFVSKTLIYAAGDADNTDSLEFKVIDKNGNDITENFKLAADMADPQDGEVVIETDEDGFFGEGLVAEQTGNVIVNLYVAGTDPVVQTGNTIISIKAKAAEKLTSLGKFTLATAEPANFEKVNTSIFFSDDAYVLYPELLNEAGKAYTTEDAVLEYKSYNNAVVLVDKATGEITPVSTGKASVLVTATVTNDEAKVVAKVSKTYEVEVKADPKAAVLNVDTTSLKLTTPVEGYDALTGTVKISLLDQYGKAFLGSGDVVVKVDKYENADKKAIIETLAGTVTLESDDESNDYATAKLEVTPASVGSLKITVSYGNLSKAVTVNVVTAGAKAGYVAEINSAKLDLYADNKADTPSQAEIKVFAKDAAGNKIYEIKDYTLEITDKDGVLSGDDLTAVAKGKATVVVKVGTAKVATYAIEVVDTTPELTVVTQAKNVITFDLDGEATLAELIFGSFDEEDGSLLNADKVAFVTKDQHGDAFQVSEDDVMIKVVQTNGSVVKTTISDLEVGTDIGKKAVVTVTILDKVYILEVYVK